DELIQLIKYGKEKIVVDKVLDADSETDKEKARLIANWAIENNNSYLIINLIGKIPSSVQLPIDVKKQISFLLLVIRTNIQAAEFLINKLTLDAKHALINELLTKDHIHEQEIDLLKLLVDSLAVLPDFKEILTTASDKPLTIKNLNALILNLNENKQSEIIELMPIDLLQELLKSLSTYTNLCDDTNLLINKIADKLYNKAAVLSAREINTELLSVLFLVKRNDLVSTLCINLLGTQENDIAKKEEKADPITNCENHLQALFDNSFENDHTSLATFLFSLFNRFLVVNDLTYLKLLSHSLETGTELFSFLSTINPKRTQEIIRSADNIDISYSAIPYLCLNYYEENKEFFTNYLLKIESEINNGLKVGGYKPIKMGLFKLSIATAVLMNHYKNKSTTSEACKEFLQMLTQLAIFIKKDEKPKAQKLLFEFENKHAPLLKAGSFLRELLNSVYAIRGITAIEETALPIYQSFLLSVINKAIESTKPTLGERLITSFTSLSLFATRNAKQAPASPLPSAPLPDPDSTAKEFAKVEKDSAKAKNDPVKQYPDNTGVAAPLPLPYAGAGVPRESSPTTNFRQTGPEATTEEDPADLYRGCAGVGVSRDKPYDEVSYAVAPRRTQTGFNPALMPEVPSAPIEVPTQNLVSTNEERTCSLNPA
ncbi:MAG TPA: hypothetical protein VD770_02205, partial [Coxiellaceae bacterium]|nr:hypothetical protein [Coxiellaceae bacterium]